VHDLVEEFLDEAVDSESASKIRDLIVDDVVTDIREASSWCDDGVFSYGDLWLAIGRTLCKRLGIPED